MFEGFFNSRDIHLIGLPITCNYENNLCCNSILKNLIKVRLVKLLLNDTLRVHIHVAYGTEAGAWYLSLILITLQW